MTKMTDKELFLYELSGHGYEFKNTTFANGRFEDDSLNMAWEMWQASAKREGFVLVPLTRETAVAIEQFKIGDKIVTLPDHNPYPLVLTVSEVGTDGWFFESSGKYCNGAICRHATDEEIKAGRRL